MRNSKNHASMNVKEREEEVTNEREEELMTEI